MDTLDIVPLVGCVLEYTFRVHVDRDLAIVLHFQLNLAILTPKALANFEPFTVTKSVGNVDRRYKEIEMKRKETKRSMCLRNWSVE